MTLNVLSRDFSPGAADVVLTDGFVADVKSAGLLVKVIVFRMAR
jgi:fatty acid/phospholipid biosynthesis enzyme